MAGGMPVTKEYAETIGVNGYGESDAASLKLASRLIGS
jgi:methanogenic corrinoid protein MtbC1